ncbi:MAG: FtsX-like permease family protein [Phycisphaerales bacterium]|nr:FtsX-like permease family protein [Phycisphaerales bacterium]
MRPLDRLAYRMLIGDRLKYLSLVAGLVFASLLVVQQASIFTGYADRTGSWILDSDGHDLWVMDEQVDMSEDSKPLLQTALSRVRGIDGVAWAVPLYKNYLKARLPHGKLITVRVVGIDDASLAGGPRGAAREALAALRRDQAILVNEDQLATTLAVAQPDGTMRPVAIGDSISINEHQATVAGTFPATPDFFWDPVLYTTYSRALAMAPPERRSTTYVLVKAKPGVELGRLASRIREATGFAALTTEEFAARTRTYVLAQTGILINFGITIVLGFVIGTLVAAQTLYSFILENQRSLAALKAMGVRNARIARMVVVQVLVVGVLGYGIGAGLAALSGSLLDGAGLAFRVTWTTLLLGLLAILTSCTLAGLLGIRRVMRLDPASVFKT